MDNNHPYQTLLYLFIGGFTWIFSEQGVIFLDAILKMVSIISFSLVIVVNIPKLMNTLKGWTGK